MADFTLAVASSERSDRLYPGAANLFRTPGGAVCVAYGAAGVAWGLTQAGVPLPDAHLEWLQRQAIAMTTSSSGLFEGTSGVALVLDELGCAPAADEMWDRALSAAGTDHSLTRGRAGLGVAALLASAWRPTLRQCAQQIGVDLLTDQAWTGLRTRRGGPAWGLVDGPSGVALLLLRLFETTGIGDFLDGARVALATDLDRLFPGLDWSDPAQPSSPGPWQRATLHRGSAGTAMVLRDALAHTPDPALTVALARLDPAHDLWHHEQPGLFTGRAGMMAAVRHVGPLWRDPAARLATQHRLLRLHAVHVGEIHGYLGDHGLKMSCDLASGATGIAWVRRGGTVPFCFPGAPGLTTPMPRTTRRAVPRTVPSDVLNSA